MRSSQRSAVMVLAAAAMFALVSAILVWSVGLLADMITRLHLRPQRARRIGDPRR